MFKPTEMDWLSDHALSSISMMGLPLIRVEMRNVYQRPIFRLNKLATQKDDLQNLLRTLMKEARLKKDGLTWLSDQISVWMEANLDKTGSLRNLEANYKSIKEYKEVKALKQRITDILRQGEGEDWQRAIDIILEEIKEKTYQQREGFEEQVGKWIEQGTYMVGTSG